MMLLRNFLIITLIILSNNIKGQNYLYSIKIGEFKSVNFNIENIKIDNIYKKKGIDSKVPYMFIDQYGLKHLLIGKFKNLIDAVNYYSANEKIFEKNKIVISRDNVLLSNKEVEQLYDGEKFALLAGVEPKLIGKKTLVSNNLDIQNENMFINTNGIYDEHLKDVVLNYVQIRASTKKMSKEGIKKFYKYPEKVIEKIYKGWYIYLIDKAFSNFADASILLNQLKIETSFVVYVKNGFRIEKPIYAEDTVKKAAVLDTILHVDTVPLVVAKVDSIIIKDTIPKEVAKDTVIKEEDKLTFMVSIYSSVYDELFDKRNKTFNGFMGKKIYIYPYGKRIFKFYLGGPYKKDEAKNIYNKLLSKFPISKRHYKIENFDEEFVKKYFYTHKEYKPRTKKNNKKTTKDEKGKK